MYFVTRFEGGRDSITVTSQVITYPLLAVLTSRFRRQVQGWNAAASWCEAFPCLSRNSRDSSDAFTVAADPFRGLPEPLHEDHNSGMLCGLHGPPGKGAGMYSRQEICFHAVVAQLWFCISSHQAQYPTQLHQPKVHKATHKLQGGEVPPCLPRSRANKGHIPHPSGRMWFTMASCLGEPQWGTICPRNLY